MTDLSHIAESLHPLAIPLDDCHLDPANARTGHDIDGIAASLSRYGQRKPIVVNAAEGMKIEAGNGTWQAAKALGWSTIAAVVVNDDSMTAVSYGIADNRIGDKSGWDLETLKALVDSIDPELDLPTGFADGEIEAMLEAAGIGSGGNGAGDAEPQTDRAEELRALWGVELGQMWRLPSRVAGQEHRLICGDCTEAAVVERVMGGDSPPVVVFTDPPYGVSIGKKNVMLNSFQPSGRNLTDIVSDDLSPVELKAMLLPAFSLVNEIMAEDCSVFVTAPQGGELGSMMMMMMMEAGLPVRHVFNWIKSSQTFSMGRLDYDYKHEPILFTWGKKHRKNKGLGFNNSCWEIAKPRSSAEHPTMKPAELYEQAYNNHSDVGEIVYEPFSGSGTALIAAENLSRQCRAVEISPAYVAVALQRYQDAFGITPELLP